jgi:hypothetical protein
MLPYHPKAQLLANLLTWQFFFFFFLKFGDVLCEGKISAGFSIFIFQKKSKKKKGKKMPHMQGVVRSCAYRWL